MEDKSGYQDLRSSSLFSGLGWVPDHICVWPWEGAPHITKQHSSYGGDEDGVAWIPSELLDVYESLIERLWGGEDDARKIRFSDGMLVIWAHA
jgi:hypothetical protein